MNEIEKLRGASNRYAEIAQYLQDEGLVKEADLGFSAAASIDLEDAELQNCWGGPFNGQTARCDLVQKIIQLWNPDIIVETGTFRGVTTEWLAQTSSVPIYSCEKNKRFFLQSKQRLAKWKNIHLELQDSRNFIRQIAATDVSQKKVLFYLDAHWEQDLPLREEIALIFQMFESPCVIIDDFKVPFDFGYTFDDYGPGKVLSLEILDGLLPPEIQIAFPSTPSESETGARRGAIILMRNEASSLISSTNLVRLADYRDWRIAELEASAEKPSALANQLIVAEADRAARWEQIQILTNKLAETEADRAARWEQIQILTNKLAETEADSAARWEQIQILTNKLAETEADGKSRWEQIEQLTGWLKTEKTQHESLKTQHESLQMNVRTLFARKGFRLLNGITHWPEVKELNVECQTIDE